MRKPSLRAAIGGAVVLVGAAAATITLLPNAYAATPTAPYTALTLDGTGDLVGAAEEFDSANATVTASATLGANNVDLFILNASDGTNTARVDLAPDPAGSVKQLAPGTFTTNQSGLGADDVIDVTVGSSSCTAFPGSITIQDVTHDSSTQLLTSLSATFSVTCDSGTNPITGEIRWNTNTAYVATVFDRGVLAFGGLTVGAPSAAKTTTFTGRGPTPVQFGTASLSGTAAAQYKISADSCSGKSLSYGATCAISVVATLNKVGEQDATLTLPDNTASGKHMIALTASGNSTTDGFYRAITPTRIMDSRSGLGAPKQPLGAGTTVHLQVANAIQIPADNIEAVVLNVTATNVTGPSFITVSPSLVARPNASSLNVVKGFTGANSVTVATGSNGGVDIFNNANKVDVIVDVMGFYTSATTGLAGGQFQPLDAPVRLDDTRTDGGGQLPGGFFLTETISFNDTSINAHIRGFVVNITATNPKGAGFLTGFNGDGNALPPTSTLNYVQGQTVPNFAVIPSCNTADCGSPDGSSPTIGIFTSQTTDVIIDLVGFMDDGTLPGGLRFTPNTPTRIVDSRIGQGIAHKLGQGATATVVTPGALLKMPNTFGLSLNVTAVNASTNTFVTVWPNGQQQPTVSNLNPVRGQTIPNAAASLLGPNNDFNVFNNAGTVDMVIDVTGTFWLNPITSGVPDPSPTRGLGSNARKSPVLTPQIRPSTRHQIS